MDRYLSLKKYAAKMAENLEQHSKGRRLDSKQGQGSFLACPSLDIKSESGPSLER